MLVHPNQRLTMSVTKKPDAAVEEARRVLTVKKRNYTRWFNILGKVTQFATTQPSQDAAAACHEKHARLTTAYDELIDALEELANLDPKATDEVEAFKDDIQTKYEDMELRVLATLADCTPTTTNLTQNAPNPNANQRAKINDSLKPFVCLCRTALPCRFPSVHWGETSLAFYSPSPSVLDI